jgi:uncharacterized glyoxalase superfamily protein PhnB
MSPDPFDALAALADEAPTPDSAFVARLRGRLQAALAPQPTPSSSPAAARAATASQGVPMSDLATTPLHVLAGQGALSPYIAVSDARAAIAWYQSVLGAVPDGNPIVMDDGRIGHAQLRFDGSLLMLSDEYPEIGVTAPPTVGGTTFALAVYVPNCDAAIAAAEADGATVLRPPADSPYGHRGGVILDPWGHRWMVNTADAAWAAIAAGGRDAGTVDLGTRDPAGTTAAVGETDAGGGGRQGDIGYWTLAVPDAAKAQAFYGSVLGWTFEPGHVENGFNITSVTPMGGLFGHGGDATESGVTHCYQVDDVVAGVARVRAAGGAAADPAEQPYGLLAECTDDQGLPFQLWQPPT